MDTVSTFCSLIFVNTCSTGIKTLGEFPAFYEIESGFISKNVCFRKDDQDSAGKRSAKKKNKRNIETVRTHFKLKHNFPYKQHQLIVYSLITSMVSEYVCNG